MGFGFTGLQGSGFGGGHLTDWFSPKDRTLNSRLELDEGEHAAAV